MAHSSSPPVAWTIAGSDSGGGAGIQADLKTMNAFGVHGCTVVTAITAQNTQGVAALESVSPALLRAQLDALASDLPPGAIKIGMLGHAETCKIVDECLPAQPFLVCDPVLKSTSGAPLLDPAALEILIGKIFPKVDLLTPNRPEVDEILGSPLRSTEAAAEQLLKLGVGSVLIKGGHAEGDECRDYWTDGAQSLWLSSPRIKTAATHGTGCILSSAITSALAQGQAIPDAIATAKTFLNQCLKSPARLGAGSGPMKIEPFKDAPADRPTVR